MTSCVITMSIHFLIFGKKRNTHYPKRSYKILLSRTHFLEVCQKFLQDHRVPTALSWVSGFFIRPISKHLSTQLSATNAPLPKATHQSTEEVIWKDIGNEAGAHSSGLPKSWAQCPALKRPWPDISGILSAWTAFPSSHYIPSNTHNLQFVFFLPSLAWHLERLPNSW